MVKLAHLLVLSSLIIWLAVSGCIGNDTSKVKEAGTSSNYTEVRNSSVPNDSSSGASAEDLEVGLSQTELKELDSDMSDLQNLLENSSSSEEIVIENAETGKSENLTIVTKLNNSTNTQ
jgi:hypothetical protein